MDVKAFYNALEKAQEEMQHYAFNLNTHTKFEVAGVTIEDDLSQAVNIKRGQMIEVIKQLEYVLDNAISVVGSLETVVELAAQRQKKLD